MKQEQWILKKNLVDTLLLEGDPTFTWNPRLSTFRVF